MSAILLPPPVLHTTAISTLAAMDLTVNPTHILLTNVSATHTAFSITTTTTTEHNTHRKHHVSQIGTQTFPPSNQWYDHDDNTHLVFPSTHANGRHHGRRKPSTSNQTVSTHVAQKISFILVIILIPCFSIFGSVGNILSLVVLVHQRMRNATNILLAALAISDLMVLLHAAYFSFLRMYKLNNTEGGDYLRTLTFPVLGPFSSVFTARITTCLTTLLSLERLVAVYRPMTAKTRCSKSTTAIYIAAIYIVTPVMFLPTAFKYHSCPKRIGNTTSLVMELTPLGQNKSFFAIYGNVLNVLFRLIPILILMVVNTLIAVAIKRVWSSRRCLSQGTSSMMEQTRITIMLVMVSVVFLVCILPGAVHSIYNQTDRHYTRFGSQSNLYNVVATVTYFLETVNSSVNFCIYMAFSKKFSRTYKEIFCCGRTGDVSHSNFRSIFKFSLRGSKPSTNTPAGSREQAPNGRRYPLKVRPNKTGIETAPLGQPDNNRNGTETLPLNPHKGGAAGAGREDRTSVNTDRLCHTHKQMEGTDV